MLTAQQALEITRKVQLDAIEIINAGFNEAIDEVLKLLKILKNDNETAIANFEREIEYDHSSGISAANAGLIKTIAEITRLKR